MTIKLIQWCARPAVKRFILFILMALTIILGRIN